VTGATGMVGSHIVERLAGEGASVRALVRDARGAAWLARLGAELVEGDIGDADSLQAAASGCDLVFHAAAALGPFVAYEPYRLGNVVGTRNVVEAAARVGARMVHVSSTAVYAGDLRWRHAPTGEDVPLVPHAADDPYGRSKLEAERVVLEACADGRLHAAIVRPPAMYGRRDRQLVPRIAPLLARGVFPLVAGGRSILSLAHAGSVAEGAVLAARIGAADGRAYNLTNDFPVTVGQFVRLAGVGLGRPIRTIAISEGAARVGCRALRVALDLSGRGELARHTEGLLQMLSRDNPFTSERARRELGWAPREPPDEAIPAAFAWYRMHRQGSR
jgi:UDP-glucose 4-epimerase